jgi:F-type H+-transporting ATPase subunit a
MSGDVMNLIENLNILRIPGELPGRRVFGRLFGMASDNPLSHVVPHKIDLPFYHGDLTLLSDQMVMMIFAGLLLMIGFPLALRRRRGASETEALVNTGFGNLIEMVCEYFRKEVAEPQLGKYTDRFIKYIWSVFFFILTINLLGLLPLGVISPVVFKGHHYMGGTATGNIWVTATLAILTLILMVYNGIKIGGWAYLEHFMPGPRMLAPMMIVLELIGLFAKTASLAIRLFANMLAGHVLMAVLVSLILMAGSGLGLVGGLGIGLVVTAGSVAITMLEIFVAFLQAFIFTYLTTLFIAMSVNVHHDDDHGEAAAH